VGATGLELLQESPRETGVERENNAQSDARGAQSGAIDPDLAAIIDAWPTLPGHVRQVMVQFAVQH